MHQLEDMRTTLKNERQMIAAHNCIYKKKKKYKQNNNKDQEREFENYFTDISSDNLTKFYTRTGHGCER